jgi:hypothetical protein
MNNTLKKIYPKVKKVKETTTTRKKRTPLSASVLHTSIKNPSTSKMVRF